MNQQPARLLVCVRDREVRLKIAGRANFVSGPDFKTLVTELQQRGYRRFLIEVSECGLMDSTFLGLLCGLGLKLSESGDADAGVELLNPNPRVAELVESLGVCSVVRLGNAPASDWNADAATVSGSQPRSREEMTETSLEAHETLMSLSTENQARFKDVTKFLAEDLQRIKAAS